MATKTASTERAQVLIVDDSSDSRAVLRTVLEHRGLKILEAENRAGAMQLLQIHQPAVTVVDAESMDAEEENGAKSPFSAFEQASRDHASSLVVIGQLRGDSNCLPSSQILPKPYHYGPLVRTIEHLLDNVQATK